MALLCGTEGGEGCGTEGDPGLHDNDYEVVTSESWIFQ